MKRILFVIVLCLLSGLAAAQERTTINDTAAAKMLLGRHMFSLQWISWDHFGSATVSRRNGVYFLKGEQKGRGNTDHLQIDGRIVSIDSKEFVFDGTVMTRVSHINGGEPCTRTGEMAFKITGKRKYWRLQQMDNPCEPVTDYVDIFFR